VGVLRAGRKGGRRFLVKIAGGFYKGLPMGENYGVCHF